MYVVITKSKCCKSFTNNSKAIPHTIFETLATIFDTKLRRFHSCFFELKMLGIFTKILLELGFGYGGSFKCYKVILKNEKGITKEMQDT